MPERRDSRTTVVAFVLAAVAVAVATAWVYGSLERYQPDGRDWLAGIRCIG